MTDSSAPQAQDTSPTTAGDSGPQIPDDTGPAPSVTQSGTHPTVPSTTPSPISPFAATAEAPQPPDLAARLAAVNEIADADTRETTEANIRLVTQREIAAFIEQQRNAKAQAKAIIDQGGNIGTLPAKLLLAIDRPGRQALQNYVRAHGNPRSDAITYYRLKNLALDDPASFQAVDLGNHMAELDARDYSDLTKLQSEMGSGQMPADFPLQQIYKTQTDRLLQQLGLPAGSATAGNAAAGDTASGETAKAGHPDAQMVAQLRRDIDLALAAHKAVQGRPASAAEQQQILDQTVINHYLTRRQRMSAKASAMANTSAGVKGPR